MSVLTDAAAVIFDMDNSTTKINASKNFMMKNLI